MGGETQKRSWQVLKKGGILVSILGQPSQKEADAHGVRQASFVVRPNAAELAQIADLVDSGEVKPLVETILPLSEARRAQELSQPATHVERSCSRSHSAKPSPDLISLGCGQLNPAKPFRRLSGAIHRKRYRLPQL